MTAKTVRFKVSGLAQDRIKLPGSFWARLKTMGLTPAAVLRHSQLPPTVYSGEGLVTTAQLFALWRTIRGLLKHEPKHFRDLTTRLHTAHPRNGPELAAQFGLGDEVDSRTIDHCRSVEAVRLIADDFKRAIADGRTLR